MELIKISENAGQQVVSARELHTFLEVASNFTTWANRMFDYGFEANKDFIPLLEETTIGRPSTDYALTLDCAKEISMLQRSDKGKEARRYFIECEKKLKQPRTLTRKEMAYAVIEAEEAREAAEEAQRLAEAEATRQQALVEELAPQAEYTVKVLNSTSTYRVSQIALELNMSAIKLNTTLKEKGVQHKVNGQWCLNSKHMNKDYIDTSTYLYTKSDGTAGTSMSLVWTEKGRKFIHDLLNPNLSKSLKTIDE